MHYTKLQGYKSMKMKTGERGGNKDKVYSPRRLFTSQSCTVPLSEVYHVVPVKGGGVSYEEHSRRDAMWYKLSDKKTQCS